MLYPSIWGMDDEFLDGSESAELDDYEAKEIFPLPELVFRSTDTV